MPMVTPRATWSQQGRNGVRAPPQRTGKQQGHIAGAQVAGEGRGVETMTTPRKSRSGDCGGGGGGVLMGMFERARSKAAAVTSEKEKTTLIWTWTSASASAGRKTCRDHLQDVSDIVVACRPGQAPGRRGDGGGGVAGDRDSPSPDPSSAFANPFARKQISPTTSTAHGVFDPSSFLTPAAVSAGGARSRSNSAAKTAISGSVSEAGIDAWSRLGQGFRSSQGGGGGGSTPDGCRGGCPNQAAATAAAKATHVPADRTFAAGSPVQRDGSVGMSGQIEHESPPPTPTTQETGCSRLGVPEVRQPVVSSSNKRPLSTASLLQGQSVAHGGNGGGPVGKKARQGAGGRGLVRPSGVATRKGTPTLLSFFGRAPAPPNGSL